MHRFHKKKHFKLNFASSNTHNVTVCLHFDYEKRAWQSIPLRIFKFNASSTSILEGFLKPKGGSDYTPDPSLELYKQLFKTNILGKGMFPYTMASIN